MKKYQDSKVPITIDPVTNEYQITVPEWVVNEFDWYEDTELVCHVDDTGIHIQNPCRSQSCHIVHQKVHYHTLQ